MYCSEILEFAGLAGRAFSNDIDISQVANLVTGYSYVSTLRQRDGHSAFLMEQHSLQDQNLVGKTPNNGVAPRRKDRPSETTHPWFGRSSGKGLAAGTSGASPSCRETLLFDRSETAQPRCSDESAWLQ